MKGSVRKRGATWSYYFDLGKVDGKRKRKEKKGFRTKKEAEAALAKALHEYNNAGAVFEPTEITVADYLNQWFDLYCKTNLKYNTQVGYHSGAFDSQVWRVPLEINHPGNITGICC